MTTKYPTKPGLVRITNTRTGEFFLTFTEDVNHHCIKLASSLRKGAFYYAHLKSKFTSVDDLDFSYVEAQTPSKARNLKQSAMKENYNNPLMLNKSDWPKTPGVYHLIHKETGTTLIGYSNDIIARRNYIKHRLKCGLVENETIQKLFNVTQNFDDFEYKISFTETITEARLLARKVVRNDYITDQLANVRYITRRRVYYHFYIVTEKKTGYFLTGCCKDLGSRINNIRWLLKTGKHRSPILQSIFNNRDQNEIFEDMFTVTSEKRSLRQEAEQLRINYSKQHKDSPLCLDSR